MSPDAKPAPIADRDSEPFWEYCRAHELRAQRCSSCGAFRWPPRTFCPKCYAWEYEWARLSGLGTVYSFSVVHHAVLPAFKEEAPYVVALISLEGTDDEVKLLSNVVECPADAVHVGMRVELTFDDAATDVPLPKFRRV